MNRYAKGFKRGNKWYYRGKSGKAIPITTSPARYRDMAKDPNRRASVPDRYLSPDQRRERLMNKRLNATVGGGTSTTYRDVAREANADANVRYGQQESDLQGQFARSAYQMKRVPAYMEQYKQALAQAQQASQQAYSQAASQARMVGQSDQANTAAQQAEMLRAAQAAAAQRGGSVDPSVLQNAIQAAGVRQGRNEIQAQSMDALGANESAFYNRGMANIPLRLVEELNRERGFASELERDRRRLSAEKGEFNQSQRAKILDRERSYGMENQVLGLNTAKAQMDAEQKAADRQFRQSEAERKRRQQLADKRRDREFRNQDREDRQQFQSERDAKNGGKSGGKDKYGNTEKDRRRAQDAYSAALNIARQVGGNDWKTIQNFLISKKKINPVYARAAAMQAALGYVGNKTAAELQRRGVRKGFKKATRKAGKGVKQGGSGFGGFG